MWQTHIGQEFNIFGLLNIPASGKDYAFPACIAA